MLLAIHHVIASASVAIPNYTKWIYIFNCILAKTHPVYASLDRVSQIAKLLITGLPLRIFSKFLLIHQWTFTGYLFEVFMKGRKIVKTAVVTQLFNV